MNNAKLSKQINRKVNRKVKAAVKNIPKRQRQRRVVRSGFSKVRVPISTTSTFRAGNPRIRNVRDGIIVTHREYIKPITGTNQFSLTVNQRLNPGNPYIFPWLSRIASNYETYRVQDFKIHYVNTCATTTSGSVVLYIDYDASDDPPATEQMIMGCQNAVNTPPYVSKYHTSTVQQLNKAVKERYVDPSGLSNIPEIKLYDFGKMYVSTSGCSTTGNIGNVYVEYTFHFRTPILNPQHTAQATSWFAIQNAGSAAHPFLANNNFTWSGSPAVFDYMSTQQGSWDSVYLLSGYYYMYVGDSLAATQTITLGWNSIVLRHILAHVNGGVGVQPYVAAIFQVKPTDSVKRFDVQWATVPSEAFMYLASVSEPEYLAMLAGDVGDHLPYIYDDLPEGKINPIQYVYKNAYRPFASNNKRFLETTTDELTVECVDEENPIDQNDAEELLTEELIKKLRSMKNLDNNLTVR